MSGLSLCLQHAWLISTPRSNLSIPQMYVGADFVCDTHLELEPAKVALPNTCIAWPAMSLFLCVARIDFVMEDDDGVLLVLVHK